MVSLELPPPNFARPTEMALLVMDYTMKIILLI
jgi:hypothetical protein